MRQCKGSSSWGLACDGYWSVGCTGTDAGTGTGAGIGMLVPE